MGTAKLRIAEVFTSLQGEGSLVGTPSTFVRVSGCNLRCTWCDTPYASHQPEGPILEVEEVIRQALAADVGHVVVTGGEPMIFSAVAKLCEGLSQEGRHITIETAGTAFLDLPCDLMSISPKLANSTPDNEYRDQHERTRKDLSPLVRLIERYACQFKFVVRGSAEIDEVAELLALLPDHGHPVYLMAEGTEPESIHRRQRELAPLCIERGWRLTPRLHIDLFGNSRGT